MSSEHVLYILLRLALGIENTDPVPIDVNWTKVIKLAERHGISAIAWDGFQCLYEVNTELELDKPSFRQQKYDWFGSVLQCEMRNVKVNTRCRELYELFSSNGVPSCILKGQGVAQLYPVPNHRQSGDIDFWALGERDAVLRVARNTGVTVRRINVKHADAVFFDDVSVEVHYSPGYFYNPIANKRFKKWIRKNAEEQFIHYDEKLGFSYPTVSFNLVYLLYHLFQHVLYEGIGLRQVTDYCCVLLQSDRSQREEAYKIIGYLKMGRFCAGIMWVIKDVYGVSRERLLCESDEKEGRFLLDEFLNGAAFGRFDERNRRPPRMRGMLGAGFSHMRRDLRFLTHYPGEVLCAPFWKIWHWAWRAVHGYLKT